MEPLVQLIRVKVIAVRRLRLTVDDINHELPEAPKNYGNYGIFLNMGNAGFIASIVGFRVWHL